MAVGEFFESFDEAWAYFLARDEPLESFYDEFTGGSFAGEVWLIAPTPEVKRAALRVQSALERFDFLDVVPHHFLHVSVSDTVVERLETPVDLEYANVTCFHTAVVAEVHAPALQALDPGPTFLPHLTLAVVKRETGSWKWPAFLFVYMTTLAWVASFAVYQGGRLLGFQ